MPDDAIPEDLIPEDLDVVDDDREVVETVPTALEGQRVDRVVAMVTGRPRSEVDSLVADGRVRIGGRVTTNRSRKLHTGELLEVSVPPEAALLADAPDPSVDVPVIWADEQVIVVDKPAGMVVHPGAGHDRGTMVQGLLARYPDLAALAVEPGARGRPGIVHRLDRGTSGLLVVARTAEARAALVAQLAERSVERRYLALVYGRVEADDGLIDAPLGRADRDPTRIVVRTDGKEARTRYRVEARFAAPVPATLLECRLETGRTHQIRVHVMAIGHPVVGDDRYGSRAVQAVPGIPTGRPWLHAAGLSFKHPADGRQVSFSSPLPAELSAVVERFVPES
ncbi:RluA family pseudouridine synthase [Acidiferrimicrobium sp. IK]|uniref:RluA family pseudouridine synthase n=1 Tax=Acidiferrimicrobium sp. IK TaxID=2871700 RepID=UPI0021CAF123|nr:RluA family pseudouridine synthase [Acidiferrimicrobium sp. IK]MCU4183672.1 RluA family pseudouridine synthase [Acidiferrimicrobium sp. IK]